MVSLRKLLPRFSLRTLAIFTLLATSAVALWLHWEPWYREAMMDGPPPLTLDGLLPSGRSPDEVRRAVANEVGVGHAWIKIEDARTGKMVAAVDDDGDYLGQGRLSTPECRFSADGNALIVQSQAADGPGPAWTRIYRRRRPEWWWGVFWLWEFWLTAVFAGLFIWSVLRDRKALGRVAPSPHEGEGGDGG